VDLREYIKQCLRQRADLPEPQPGDDPLNIGRRQLVALVIADGSLDGATPVNRAPLLLVATSFPRHSRYARERASPFWSNPSTPGDSWTSLPASSAKPQVEHVLAYRRPVNRVRSLTGPMLDAWTH
jgi:hypothetical protein